MMFTFPKKNEYFVKELDEKRVKADRSLLGKFFMVSRYIHRIGYQFEPNLSDPFEVEKEEENLLLEVFRTAIAQQKEARILLKIDPVGDSGLFGGRKAELSEEGEILAKNLLRIFKGRRYPMPRYVAKGNVACRHRKTVGEEAEWRRMWFVDCGSSYPYHEEVVVKLVETTRALTGKWYPASGGYDSYTGESDYEPGGLYPAFHQTLFLAFLYTPYVSGWKYDYGAPVLVHPEDVAEFKSDLPILP